jgi:hypothetical protein
MPKPNKNHLQHFVTARFNAPDYPQNEGKLSCSDVSLSREQRYGALAPKHRYPRRQDEIALPHRGKTMVE